MSDAASEIVPVIDLQSPDAPKLIDAACRDVGFLSVVNHGIPDAVIQRMLRATDAFFAMPVEAKLALIPPTPDNDRGYAAKGSESLYQSLGHDDVPADLFEAYNVGPDIGPDGWPEGDPRHGLDQPLFTAGNIWPAQASQAELRPALMAYFEETRQLAHRLTGLFAKALDLAPDYFEGFTDHATDTMRVNHYERGAGEPEPVTGQQRMGAHSDYGVLTVLYADRVPGLQIVGPDNEWHDVMPAPSALLVNLGDLLAQWTNDHWRSTLHRVVPPPRTASGPNVRRSVAFFHEGNFDGLIECLPTCVSADRPARYEPVLAGEHLLAKLMGPRTLTASTATSTTFGRPTQ
ncbi:MAG: putative Oxidoreductase, 2OG-Fe(II) oxygenase family [Mycobacterium sp.]|nr:putative Oxidoreductase, 2OG-Fe(II) oxygenase family [Mycobacterium sp.]